MIIYSANGLKAYETRSDKPASDWTGKAEYILDETDEKNAELIEKVRRYAPYFEVIADSSGKVTDVIKTADMEREERNPDDPVSELYRENKALRERVESLTESTQLLEECIVEMAQIVYA